MVIPESLSLFTPEARLVWVAEAFDGARVADLRLMLLGRVEYHTAHGPMKRKNAVDRFWRV
jgi:hypothetical protein